MASDTKANYFRIGLAVVLGVAAIAGALVYIGGVRGRESEVYAETYSDKPVSGLSVGSAVNFRGVKIGEVRRISFVRSDYGVRGRGGSRIRIVMAIKEKFMKFGADDDAKANLSSQIEHGLRATVTASGITGLSHIELDFIHADVSKPAEITWHPENLYIPPGISFLDNFSDSATRVMNEIEKIDFEAFRSDFAGIMRGAAETVSNANALVSSVNTLVDSRKSDMEAIVDDLRAASGNLREATDRIATDPSLLLRPAQTEPLEETRR
ncbi:MAG: MlaD family protein [Kiritimatiellae bacterium]|nr:MlaD family protein [Kiritimatiellia bacterium]